MNQPAILLADDDQELAALLRDFLVREGFDVRIANDAESAIARARETAFDAIVLDVMLPGRSGLDVLRELRRESATPVLMLTALGEDIDRILGLELGADDYIPKPCNPRELAARLRAVLRRSRGEGTDVLTDLRVGRIALKAASRSVSVDGTPMALTSTEFDLLALLMREAGRVVSKERISQSVLGRPLGPYDRSIDVHVSNLRKKIAEAGDDSAPITTIHRSGYLLRQPEA
ncbi:MAG TPA: response regulator transcription factor [Dokdonella sp.]|uniref:response regulator transcription factor n=1 Tax=Dokdonella sp. TaxID=2291710 RepID=UPI0025BA71F6|nr:response regulator transcription factor [Dokdonella sp.]MBX3690785.1 response regulator transcription factor [Dokdonella sp.]MCW5566632.1 response regulator transcription factor [Dokdonella sp.]HNR91701.1 response regulator transcription factor [Dokdonella sp.]